MSTINWEEGGAARVAAWVPGAGGGRGAGSRGGEGGGAPGGGRGRVQERFGGAVLGRTVFPKGNPHGPF